MVERDQMRQKAKKLLLSQKQLTSENKLLKEELDSSRIELSQIQQNYNILENQLAQANSAAEHAQATIANEKVFISSKFEMK